MEKIIIFTDGASKGNPGPGGWGALVATETTVRELGGREQKTTNNRMELRATLEALLLAATLGRIPIALHTDSSYVINGATKWVHGWKARGWTTVQKGKVLNRDLWEALLDAIEKCSGEIEWKYVGGHVGIAGNERVDSIASDFAEEKKVVLYDGARAGYEIDFTNVAHDESKQKAKSASSSRSKLRAYSYVSIVGGVVVVHKTWAECLARVQGKKARFKKAISAAEEAAIKKEFSSK